MDSDKNGKLTRAEISEFLEIVVVQATRTQLRKRGAVVREDTPILIDEAGRTKILHLVSQIFETLPLKVVSRPHHIQRIC